VKTFRVAATIGRSALIDSNLDLVRMAEDRLNRESDEKVRIDLTSHPTWVRYDLPIQKLENPITLDIEVIREVWIGSPLDIQREQEKLIRVERKDQGHLYDEFFE